MADKTNEQQIKEHINDDELFSELSELIKEVAFSRRMFAGMDFFLWAKAHTLFIEDNQDAEYVAHVILAMKDD